MGLLAWSTAVRSQCSTDNEILNLPIESSVTQDLSAFSQTITISGTETYAIGQDGDPNGALSFSTGSDYVRVPANPSLMQMSDGFTMAAWVYPTSVSNYNTFVGKVASNGFRNIVFRFHADGKVQIHFTAGASIISVTTDDPFVTALNQWYHLAATWDKDSQMMRIYVNGVLRKEQVLTSPFHAPNFQASGDLLIGSLVGGSEKLTGAIDDVQLKSYPMAPEDVPCLMNSSVEINDDLVLSLPLDGDGTDISSYGNDGTPNGGSAEMDRFMNTSSSMLFNGNGYLTVANEPQYASLGSAFSISAWIKPTILTGSKVILSKVGAGRDIVLSVNNGKFTVHYFVGGYVWFVPATATVPANEWTHVACTWDGATMVMYQNGEEIHSFQPGTLPNFTTNNWVVGSLSTGNENFGGQIDEVKVWSRTLAPCELLADMRPYLDLVTEDNLLLCPGQNQLVTANYGMCSYLWTNDNTTIESFNIEASTLGVGEHQVVLEAYDFYDNFHTDTVNVTVSLCTGIEEATQSNPMKLFPNPATNVVELKFSEIAEIQLLDVSGRMLKSISTLNSNSNRIDISTLPYGIYFVRGIGINGIVSTERLMKL